jgi:hypothetical protein
VMSFQARLLGKFSWGATNAACEASEH